MGICQRYIASYDPAGFHPDIDSDLQYAALYQVFSARRYAAGLYTHRNGKRADKKTGHLKARGSQRASSYDHDILYPASDDLVRRTVYRNRFRLAGDRNAKL